ncbi:MAG: hypothetical protein C0518_10360 [Opitutus sp.]|nr:hypothetical protein [Opitutus sp.]
MAPPARSACIADVKALLLAVLSAAVAALVPSVSGQTANSPHTLSLAEGAAPAKATLADFAWLTGHWVGTGFGGADVEEIWTAPNGTSMQGMFRMVRNGRAQVYEMVVLLPVGDTVEMRLKHFTAELKAWEEKEKWVTFRLVKHEANEACFEGLTFRGEDDGNTLRVWLVTSQGADRTEQEMVYRRQR